MAGEWQPVAAVAVAAITALGGVISSRNAERKETAVPTRTGPVPIPIPVVATPTEQAVFIGQLMERLGVVENRVGEQDRVIGQLRDDLDAQRTTERRFAEAVGRWLTKIARTFQEHGLGMPMPDGDDLIVLREIIPR